MFRKLFSRKFAPLTGAPPVRRLKTYSAQSGYVYQYFYAGHRNTRTNDGDCDEFVFHISADRKEWHHTSVYVSEAAVEAWEQANARQLSQTERYAIAKMALFQAFDERASPALMKSAVPVQSEILTAVLETLGL